MIYYKNSNNETIILDQNGYKCSQNALRSFSWSYEYNTLPNSYDGVVSSFWHDSRAIAFNVLAYSESRSQTSALLNKLANILEYDIRARSAGRLYIDNQYLSCYIVAGSISKASINGRFVSQSFSIVPTNPLWCIEETRSFMRTDSTQSESAENKKYNGRYAYRYGTGYSQNTITNDSETWDTPIVLTIYGAADNPSVVIGSNTYKVNASCLQNERIVIDQPNRRIYKIGTTGSESNLFNSRDKQHDIFTPVPAGSVSVSYSGDFDFDITLIHQRSTPKWS